MLLIYVLVCLFICLIGYKLFLQLFPCKIIEPLENAGTTIKEYQPYNLNDPNNSLILAQQNAGNIEVLKGRIDNLDGVKEKLDTMRENIDSIQIQMDGLVQQQADFAQEIAGSTPPEITGTNNETAEEVSISIEEEE
jgi:hypothetical protein